MIVICVPVDKDYKIDVRTAAYCSAEAMRSGVQWSYVSSRDAGVGRSTSAYYALKDPKVTHLYLLDSDVEPPNGTLQKLLDYDLPIVAGIYKMKGWFWSFKTGGGWRSRSLPLPVDLTKATAIGGSTLLVKREVFEKIKRPWFLITYKAIDDEGRCYDDGEDEYFSKIAIEAGYDLMIDPSIICKHYNYGEI